MIRMQIFGGFLLNDGQTQIDEKKLHSNKLVRLLVYIFMNRNRELSHQELIDTFWQEDSSRNPDGALKNLVYRLRTELRVLEGPELVLTSPGAYRWNPEVPAEADFEELNRYAAEARYTSDPEEKIRIGERITEIYKKDVSACLTSENWMLSRLTYYRLLYMDTVKMLSAIYASKKEWDRMEALCIRAFTVDDLDEEVYHWLIKSQIGKRKYETALQYYEDAKKVFYDNLGIGVLERFHELYEEIMAISDDWRSDIQGLMLEMKENEVPKEVYFCEYPIFREIYRVEARRLQRTGIAEHVLLITMTAGGQCSAGVRHRRMQYGMQTLEKVLRKVLRAGDVVSRYSGSQYAVLLPDCSDKSASVVSGRIEEHFQMKSEGRKLSLLFEIEALV